MSSYRGRFAPSPSGPLHFGSLLAAMGSYLDARSHEGEWLLRIEDIDPPRVVTGASDTILLTLERFGFEWDEPVLYQSDRYPAYQEAIEQLLETGKLYECVCSRSEVKALGELGIEGVIYPGTCRDGIKPALQKRKQRALRIRTDDQVITFQDRLFGVQRQDIAREIGDFVLQRADKLFAYQLAVVIDDAYQGVTDIVRGADLLSSTPRQIYLQNLLSFKTPRYMHLPLATDEQGVKLSKQCRSHPVSIENPLPVLTSAYRRLGQPMPPKPFENLDEFWRWAIAHWEISAISKSNIIV